MIFQILRRVANQGDSGTLGDEPVGSGLLDGELGQQAARRGHSAEAAMAEILMDSGLFQLPPSDAWQIACDERKDGAPPGENIENFRHGGTALVADVGNFRRKIGLLGGDEDGGHGRVNIGGREPSVFQHAADNVGVQHAVQRDAFRGGFKAKHIPNRLNQREPVLGARFADQCAVDIEKDKAGGQVPV